MVGHGGGIGLSGAFVVWSGRDPDETGPFEVADLVIAFHWVIIFALWWLGVAASPIVGNGLTAATYFPLATAMAALAVAQFAGRFTRAEGWNEVPWLPDLRFGSSHATAVDPGVHSGDFRACLHAR